MQLPVGVYFGALMAVSLCADVLRIIIWLVPARKENIPLNVPPYLNAETTVLQPINDTGYFQVRSTPLKLSPDIGVTAHIQEC
jgi:hypothetical protein